MGKLALSALKKAPSCDFCPCARARVQLGTEHALEMKMKRCAGVSLSRNISSPCLMLSGSLIPASASLFLITSGERQKLWRTAVHES
jgi:hypothetical protein